MKSANKNRTALLTIDAIIFLLCIFGVYRVVLKAYLPFNVTSENDYLIISELLTEDSQLAVKNTILTIDGYKFQHWEEVEIYTDGLNIGDEVNVEIRKAGTAFIKPVLLTHYYSIAELVIIAAVGFTFIIMAIFLRLKAPDNRSALAFHWVSMALGMVILMTAGNYSSLPFGIGYVSRVIWLVAYAVGPVLFVQFVSTFTDTAVPQYKKYIIFLYLLSISLGIILSYLFVEWALTKDIVYLQNYIEFFDVFRVFVIFCIVLAISLCFYISKISKSIEERKKLRWLLLGFFIGPFSFAIFWILPILLTGRSLLPESLIIIFLIAIPITFAIAIIRYHFMDIDVIMRRSVVYTIILTGIILTYISFSAIISIFVSDLNPAYPSIITAVLVTVMLQPVKTFVQKFIDKKFFRLEYDYRETQKRFLDDIKNTNDIETLSEKIVNQADELIPVDKIGFFLLTNPGNKIKLLAHKGFELLVGRSIIFDEKSLKTDLSLPVAVDKKVESGTLVESADLKVFRRWGMVLVFPIKSPSGVIHGFIVMGTKKSGAKYYQEDVDLINSVSSTAALSMDKIKLQEELILEHLEAERLEELNKMKSLFVSNVTHELKTPLTSIKMFAELLKEKAGCESEKSQEYLEIIEGEADRLKRLIDNVLDFAKIERGIKTYEMSVVDFNQLSLEVLNMMQYQFNISKIDLKRVIGADESFITADKDAVEEAMMNILSNAIKYSEQNTSVTVSTFKRNSYVRFKVEDEGIGISESDRKDIFNPFFRTKNNDVIKVEGTGLGLSIVKHIVDAHNGKIEMESELGKGSTFTLLFPKFNKDETNSDASGQVPSDQKRNTARGRQV